MVCTILQSYGMLEEVIEAEVTAEIFIVPHSRAVLMFFIYQVIHNKEL